MTFKKLIKMMQTIEDLSDQQNVFMEIDRAFENSKISFAEHELLIDIADWYGYGKYIYNLNMWHEGKGELK